MSIRRKMAGRSLALAAGVFLGASCSGVGPFDAPREATLPDRISVSPTDFVLGAIGGQRQLAVADGDGQPLPSGIDLSWRTSDPAVATVDDNGAVTAVGDGTATITAQLESMSASARVTVAAVLQLAVQVSALDQGDPDVSDNRVVTTITVQAP